MRKIQPAQVAFYSAMPHDKEVFEKMSEEIFLAAASVQLCHSDSPF